MMKKIIFTTLALLFYSSIFAVQTNNYYVMCSQPYALCTTASCTAIPGGKDKALCSCIVEEGISLGKTSCRFRKPKTNNQGKLALISTFSLSNTKTNKLMTCQNNHPWTDCLDMPCVIDSHNSNQATCTCNIERTKKFVTFGGQCDTTSCGTTLYSGAKVNDNSASMKALLKTLKLSKSPVTNCSL